MPIIVMLLTLLSPINIVNASGILTSKSFSIEEATIESVQDAIINHQISCEELVNEYIQRIKRYNISISKHAPINAFNEINSNVMDQARRLDANFKLNKKLSGPLHCIPIVLKDNIDSYDSTTSSGTLALLGNQPSQDAFLVAKLREAGAIILGKGGMDELASGMYGISSRSGRIGNAYNSDKNPGGSSGGPAVAVSANFTMVGIGTDNSGSVRIPVAFNGLYGLRPSTGLISQRGIFPAGNLDGVAGPLTRTVEDLARTLDAIAKKDPNDLKTLHVPRVSTYTAFLNKNGLRGKRIGIVRNVGSMSMYKDMPSNVIQVFKHALNLMEQSGAIIVDNIMLPKFNSNRDFNMAGMRQDVDEYLASYPSVRKNYQDICKSNRTRVFGNVEKCLQFFQSMPLRKSDQHTSALRIFKQNKVYVEGVMKKHQLDVLLVPISVTGSATYDPYKVNTWQAPIASNSGLPAITINLGYTNSEKMPIGVELIGVQYSEGALIEIAYAYEQHSQSRVTPSLPDKNIDLEELNISEYNNFISSIGYKSYYNVLINSVTDKPWKALSPIKFKELLK